MEHRYSLRGEIDIATAPQVRSDLMRIVDTEGAHLLVDCAGLTFIDSTGLSVLLEVYAKLRADGRHMLVLNVHGGPLIAFEALGLTDLLRYDRAQKKPRRLRDRIAPAGRRGRP